MPACIQKRVIYRSEYLCNVVAVNTYTILLLLGTFFLIYGLWWIFCAYWIHFTHWGIKSKSTKRRSNSSQYDLLQICAHEPNDPLAHKSWIPQPFLKAIPMEPIAKVVLPGLGVFVELTLNVKFDEHGKSHLIPWHYRITFSDGQFVHLNRLYHICLYSTFVLSGVVDLVSLCIKLPRVTSQLFLCFALYSESLLFSFHVHGRNLFNSGVHQLLLIFVMATALFSTLRMLTPRNLFINACFAGSMTLQGTHLIQAGWVMYGGTRWRLDSHENVKFMTALSVWHLLGVSLFMLATFVIMRAVLHRLSKTKRFRHLAMAVVNEEERESLMEGVVEDDASGTSRDSIEMHALTESPA